MSGVAGASLRSLRAALAAAPDAKIMEIAGLADAMADREEARDILEPIRARLRPLRPERKLRLSRLLVTPLQPVLVDAGSWQDGAVTLPRTAILPLCAVVEARAPAIVAQVTAMIGGATTRDAALIGEAGAVLWPAASAALMDAETPHPAWMKAGLPARSFPAMSRAVASCLALATSLDGFTDPTIRIPDAESVLGAALRQAAAVGASCWGMVLALLVCRAPHVPLPRNILIHQSAGEGRRDAAQAALDHVWSWIEDAAEGSPLDLVEAAAALQERAVLLHEFSGERLWRKQAGELQAMLKQSYAQHLARAARERLSGKVAALAAAPDDAAMLSLERDARGLRHLALSIRLLGAAPSVDAVLQEAASAVASSQVLPPVDRARLVEILHEPGSALRLLAL